MAYSISKNAKGRFVVTSPAGKTWKTTYPSSASAEKAVAYVTSRFGGEGGLRVGPAESENVPAENSDTTEERILKGIPAKPDEGEDTEGW